MNDFDDLTDLDDVFGQLRSTARPAELSKESATVDLMVKAHRTSEGKHMFTSRRARIATLVATGVLGFGGMAAASPSLGGDDPVVEKTVGVQQDESIDTDEDESVDDLADLDEVKVDEEEVDEVKVDEKIEDVKVAETEIVEVVPAEVVPAEDPDPYDDLDTDFNELYCVPGNHGKTVSAVARGEYELGVSPESVTVTEAAHSSCGKTDEPDIEVVEESEVGDESEVDEESEVEEPEVESEKSEAKADRRDKSDTGAEKAANGNGKSNGNRGD